MRDYKCTERVTMETRAVSAGYPTLAARCSTAPVQGRGFPKHFQQSHQGLFKAWSRKLGAVLVADCRLASVMMVGWQLVESPAGLAHTV